MTDHETSVQKALLSLRACGRRMPTAPVLSHYLDGRGLFTGLAGCVVK